MLSAVQKSTPVIQSSSPVHYLQTHPFAGRLNMVVYKQWTGLLEHWTELTVDLNGQKYLLQLPNKLNIMVYHV